MADTTPLNYLILIDEVDLLPFLFGQVLLPQAAFEGLNHSRTPSKVRQWMAQLPDWLEVRAVGAVTIPTLLSLDSGERDAIQSALNLGASTVLIDETEGRRVAKSLHLKVQGTLGLLERASKRRRIDFRLALNKLDQTTFRISPTVRAAFLKRNP